MRPIGEIVLIMLVAYSGLAQSSDEVSLALTGHFNLSSKRGLRGMTIRHLLVKQQHIYFTAFPGATKFSNGALVKADLAGLIDWMSELGTDEFEDLSGHNSDSVLILSSPVDGTTRLRRFDVNGRLLGEPRPLPDVARVVTLGDGGVYGLTRSGSLRPVDNSPLPTIAAINPQHLFGAAVICLPDRHVAVVDGRDAEIHILDLGTGMKVVSHLHHPEVLRVKGQYAGEEASMPGLHGRTVLLCAAYNGNIYCMLSGFRAEQGAPILVIGSTGEVSKMLRCPVTYTKRVPGAPVSMDIDTGRLFVLDSEGTVSMFDLPR